MKRTVCGYFCHTRTAQERYGYDFVLTKSEPVTKEIEHYTGEWNEEITIPQSDDDIVFNEESLFDDCEFGKWYQITIEEICQK